MRAIELQAFGGPEVLEVVDRPDPVPAANEVLIDVTAIGGSASLDGTDGRKRTFRFEIDASVAFDESRSLDTARIGKRRGSGGNAAGGQISDALGRDHAAFVFDSSRDGTDRHLDIK